MSVLKNRKLIDQVLLGHFDLSDRNDQFFTLLLEHEGNYATCTPCLPLTSTTYRLLRVLNVEFNRSNRPRVAMKKELWRENMNGPPTWYSRVHRFKPT